MSPVNSSWRRFERPSAAVAGLAVVLLIFAASVFLIGPAGDFPLIDDWSYAITTRRWVATGIWQPLGFTSMPLITNALFAFPFCKVGACSFNDLRISTFITMVILIVGTWLLLRRAGASAAIAFIGTATIAFNPIAYMLSYTFMTDIPFAAFALMSAILFAAAITTDSLMLVVFASLAATAATLSRQLGLFVPLGFLIAQLAGTGSLQKRLAIGLAPVLLCGAALIGFDSWLSSVGRSPILYKAQIDNLFATLKSANQLGSRLVLNTITILLYLGLFSAPVVFLTRRTPDQAGCRPWARLLPRLAGAGAVLLMLFGMAMARRIMPFVKGIIIPQGLGGLTLRDAYVLDLPNVPNLPFLWWVLVTLIAVAGAYGLVDRLAKVVIDLGLGWYSNRCLDRASTLRLFGLGAICAYLLPLLPSFFYDRYLIVILPLLLFLVAGDMQLAARPQQIAAGATCVLIGAFAVFSTHDYVAWSRARWAGIAFLEKFNSANASNIDGGFEYNGINNYDPHYRTKSDKSFWWVNQDEYIVAFGPIPDLKVVRSFPYQTIVPPHHRSIEVLHRSN